MSTKKLTTEEFIKRCEELYPNTFLYDCTEYVNSRTNVSIECKTHGVFTKNARSLLQGTGCPLCKTKWKNYVKRRSLTQDEFISKANLKHNNFYLYSNTSYTNSRTPVKIICPIHGEFEQTAGGHLEGYGCQQCADKKHGDYRPWLIETYFQKFPEKRNLPAKLYLLYSNEENFFKVGITQHNDINDRIKYMSGHYSFKVIDSIDNTMYNVALAEQKILKENLRYKPKYRFGGYTECLQNYVDIKKYIAAQGQKP